MDGPDMGSGGRWLRRVAVRPVRGVEERRRWDALMREHHYLPYRGLFGRSLRQVAVRGETWLALLGWQAGAFKVGVRDAWIGWTREQQFARLHLIANNARFAVLEAGRVPNLASRALGLGLRRLSGDMRAAHGHPVLLAETFVDPSRFAGTCYRASNWRLLGRTRGFSREPGGAARWRAHGRPKEVYVYELGKDGASALRGDELPGNWRNAARFSPPEPSAPADLPSDAYITAAATAELLGVVKSTVTRRIAQSQLIGFRAFTHALRIPKDQFDGDHVVPGVPDVLALFTRSLDQTVDHRAAWTFLNSDLFRGAPDPRPIDRLRNAAVTGATSTLLSELARTKESLDRGDHFWRASVPVDAHNRATRDLRPGNRAPADRNSD